ncbi:MAG: hypothetical protein K8T25_23060, partial [Planctomycetia bacterium]|nr:hypothetical protein [Planctomycetia bacterium]
MEPYQSRQPRLLGTTPLGTARAFIAGLAVLAVVLVGRIAMASLAVTHAAEPKSGTTSRAARMDAVRLIPFDKLDADARAKATAVTKANSLFRRLPVETIDCDPKLYLYLVRNPEVVVSIWQLMG